MTSLGPRSHSAPDRPRARRRWLPDYLPVAWKMALSFSALIAAGMALLGTLVLDRQLSAMTAQTDRFGQLLASQLALTSREPLLAHDAFALKVQLSNLGGSGKITGAALYDPDLQALEEVGRVPMPLPHPLPTRHAWKADGLPLVTYFADIRVDGHLAGHAAITLSQSRALAAADKARKTMIAATLLMALITTLMSFWLSRRLARPIRQLVHATARLRRGELPQHLITGSDPRDEFGQLMQAYNQMAKGLLEKSQVEALLSRYVSPQVAGRMMQDLSEVQLGGREVEATVLFADIAGFTELSEALRPDEVGEMLNSYFRIISLAADCCHGTIDKFMGDCAMLVFGVPTPHPDHRFHGACCALLIQRLVAHLNQQRQALGRVTAEFRIGLNTGPMLAGNLGCADRMQYTVVGDSVNLASRLCSLAQPGEIVAADPVLEPDDLNGRVTTRRTHDSRLIRGKRQRVATRRLLSGDPETEVRLDAWQEHCLQRLVASPEAVS